MTFGGSTYRCGNYSREETIQGRKLFAEIRYIQNYAHKVLMTFTGNKSSETILGSHACRFDKLEDFAITF